MDRVLEPRCWWRAAILVAGYLALCLGADSLSGLLFAGRVSGWVFDSPLNVFADLALGLLVGSLVLLLFLISLGWLPRMFGPHPIRGAAWMRIAPAPILLHGLFDPTLFLATGGIDRGRHPAEQSINLAIAGPSNFVIIGVGLILVFFMRGRVEPRRNADQPKRLSGLTGIGDVPPGLVGRARG